MDRVRIAQAVEARKAELGRPWKRVSGDAGMDTSTVWHVRQGERVSERSLRRLDVGLAWPAGTLEAIGRGEVAPLTASADTTEPALIALLAEVRDVLNGLARHLGAA
jgi:hypothetical protein